MKWGILATGTIARKFADTVNHMDPEAEKLIACASRNLEHGKAFAEKYGIPKVYGSYGEMMTDSEVEAVYIATPNNLHYENCRMCLEAGKHVLCEKPFTLSTEQAQELFDLAEEKGLFIMEAFWIRFLPAYDKLRAMLRDGVIGEVNRITSQFGFVAEGARRERKFKSELGGGALLDIGIYNLGFFHMITETAPEGFQSEVHMTEYGTDDYSEIELEYPGGCSGHCIQAIGKQLDRNARIEGSEGVITIADFQFLQEFTVQLKDGTSYIVKEPFKINVFEYSAWIEPSRLRNKISFADWWDNNIVFDDNLGNQLTRSDLICLVANKDGYSHVAEKLPTKYATFKNNTIVKININGTIMNPNNIPIYPAVRQISFEFISSLFELHPQFNIL